MIVVVRIVAVFFLCGCAVAAAALAVRLLRRRLDARRGRTASARTLGPGPALGTIAGLPDSRYIESNGARLHYVQAGKGPDLVLLHGIGASVFIWRALFPALQKRFRVTAIDLPGFGRSCKESRRDYGLDAQTRLIADSLSDLGIDKSILVGSSMGGTIALWLAKLHPERFPKLALLSPATSRLAIPLHAHHIVAASPFLKKALNRATMKLILARVIARPEAIDDRLVDGYLEPYLDGQSIRAFFASLSLLGDRRLPDALAGVRAEMLVIYGERDLIVRRQSVDRLLKLLPHARLLTHPSGSHHIMEDEPEWLARVLVEFCS